MLSFCLSSVQLDTGKRISYLTNQVRAMKGLFTTFVSLLLVERFLVNALVVLCRRAECLV